MPLETEYIIKTRAAHGAIDKMERKLDRHGRTSSRAFAATERKAKAMGRGVERGGKRAARGLNLASVATTKLRAGMAALMRVPVVAMLTAVVGSVAALGRSVRAAGVQDIAEGRLAKALSNLGDGSEAANRKVLDTASALQKVTNYGDEATVSAATLLATFKGVSSADGIAVLLPRIADAAASSGANLDAVAVAVGKSLEGGAASLREYGVSLDDASVAQINAAKGMEKVNLLAAVLDDNFRGLAVASADPFVRLSNAAGDASEDLGEGLLPALREFASVTASILSDGSAESLFKRIGDALGAVVYWVLDLPLMTQIAFARIDAAVLRFAASVRENLAGALDLAAKVAPTHSARVGFIAGAAGARSSAADLRGQADARDFEARFDQGDLFARRRRRTDRAERSGPAVPGTTPGGSGAGDGGDAVARARERQALMIKLMEDGAAKRLATVRQEYEGMRAEIEAEFGTDGEDLMALLDAWQERARTAILDAEKEALSMPVRGLDEFGATLAEAAAAAVEATEAEAEAMERAKAGIQQQIDAEAELIEAKRARIKATEAAAASAISSGILEAKSAADVADAVASALRRQVAGYIAKTIASALAPLGPLALILGPAIGAGIGALFNKLLPKFETGVVAFGGGTALVGERGPEIVQLPAGSTVTPASTTRNALAQQQESQTSDATPQLRASLDRTELVLWIDEGRDGFDETQVF